MGKKANIALFIPHAGCKNACSFCNQRLISGKQTVPTAEEITKQLQQAVEYLNPANTTEIAFFGGSFTALDEGYMVSLLQAAQPFLGQKGITGIRVSTRPDAITHDILQLLKRYGVTAVELGAQSTNDEVLTLNRRGHTYGHVVTAATLIKEQGLELGLQMMTGLYGSSETIDRQTAGDFIALSPKTVRIYPTVVFPDTYLYQLYRQGIYAPQTVEQAVAQCSELLVMFEQAGISVIRLGLHGDSSQNGGIGPVHPALRELCLGELFYNAICEILPAHWKTVTVLTHPVQISQGVGQNRKNIRRLAQKGISCKVVGDEGIPRNSVGITRKENSHVPEILGSTGLQIISR